MAEKTGNQTGGNGSPRLINLRTERRDDGQYLTVSREERAHVDIDKVKEAISQARITNADIEKIVEVIRRARGVPELIGKPFEFFNPEKEQYIHVEVPTPLQALVTISSEVQTRHLSITESDIRYSLYIKGITHGIKVSSIHAMVANGVFDSPVEVALGTAAKTGLDARIEELVEIDPNARPPVNADGSVDFKNIETFKQIVKGETIARRYPPTPGEDGVDVYGKAIKGYAGADKVLPEGENTEKTEDNKYLIAAVGGFLYRNKDKICIGEVLLISGNVNYTTGNIKYRGSVSIKGNVQPDFTVEANGDIYIKGEVESATIISRGGSIRIDKGVFGKTRCRLQAKNEIHCLFAQQVEIESQKEVKVIKHLLHAQVNAKSVRAGSIIGGKITGETAIEAYGIGSEKGGATEVCIVDPEGESLKTKITQLEVLEQKVMEQLTPVQKQLKTLVKMIRQTKESGDRAKKNLSEITKKFSNLKKKLEYVQKQKKIIEEKQSAPPEMNGFIASTGRVYPMVTIKMYGHILQVKTKDVKRVKFTIRDNEITVQKL